LKIAIASSPGKLLIICPQNRIEIREDIKNDINNARTYLLGAKLAIWHQLFGVYFSFGILKDAKIRNFSV
jgi:hypothetical protein